MERSGADGDGFGEDDQGRGILRGAKWRRPPRPDTFEGHKNDREMYTDFTAT
jgi:hypothetical protein